MTRSALVSFVVALCLLTVAVPAAAQTPPPNVVFIISDDHAWTDYGFMGHPQIDTPNIDALAKQSAVFTRGYVPTALCRPALATIATGLYAHQHGITGNDPAILPSMASQGAQPEPAEYSVLREALISKINRHPTLPRLLGSQGYLSHQSGKWWEGSFSRGGFTHGMTRGFPLPGGRHGDDGLKIGREGMEPVLDFIDHAIGQRTPFFVWYAPFLPHTPHNPPQRLIEKYTGMGVTSDRVARYYAMVEWFDETVGQLLAHLDARDVARNTLVVYVGDNGWIQRPDANDFAPRSKQSPYEGGVRQPTMFRWPGVVRPGDRGAQLISSIDIVPTALAAAGIDPPTNLPGFNLLPILRSGAPTPREDVLGEGFAHDIADLDHPEASLLYRWIVQGRWKLLLTYDGKLGRYARHHPRSELRPQLFDLLADPHENLNVAREHPDVVAALAAGIAAWWPVKERRVQTTFGAAAAQ
ncbi:MAG: sulfatase [Acidobacteria bacterium]|nr:sulfatase [Acidobacteriota bacterium]